MNIPEKQTSKRQSFWTITALIILLISAVFALGGSLLMLAVSLLGIANPFASFQELNVFGTLSATTMFAVFGVLSIPGIVFLIQKLSGNTQPRADEAEDPFDEMPFSRMLLPNIILAVTVLLLLVTFLLSTQVEFARWILPFLQVPAVIVPVFWLLQFGTRKIYPRDAKRNWIAFGLNLTIQPTLAVTFEVILFIALVLLAFIGMAILDPAMMADTIAELEQINHLPVTTVEDMDALIGEWLQKPMVLLFVQLFVSLLVPLLEELIKPLLILRWWKRPLAPVEGFWLGLIGGATFSIYETFGNIANMVIVEEWYTLLLARIGTSLLHMGTAALMGWALMATFKDHKWLRMIGVYLACVLLHGGWNFFAIIDGFSNLPMQSPPAMFIFTPIALPAMILVAVICTIIIVFGAAMIQKTSILPVLQPSEKSEAA